jgi:hypothetical protein
MQDESKHSRTLSEHFLLLYSEAVLANIETVTRRHCDGCKVHNASQTRHSCLMWETTAKLCAYFDEIADSVDADAITTRWCVDVEDFPIAKDYLAMYKLKFTCADWRAVEVTSSAWRQELLDRCRRLIRDYAAEEL